MAQHDYNIANQTAPNARADINNVLSAIVSNNSGSSAPTTTYANMWWYDSGTNKLKIRNEANTAWIEIGELNQTSNTFNGGTPAGAVMAFAMSSTPSGWLVCNGGAVSRTTYSQLFAAIGTTYGSGDGSTTFNLPDLRGEFVRGWDNSRGVDSGRTMGSTQDQETRWYEAEFNGANASNEYVGGPYDGQVEGKDTNSSAYTMDRFYHNWDTSLETRPRNIALNYCIKY